MKRTSVIWAGIATAVVLVFVFLQFRTKTIRQNDSAAIGRLRHLSEAQVTYRAEHPERGFACGMSDLAEDEEYSGYRFSLSCGAARSAGVVSHYQLVAQPIELGRTGLKTYCITEERRVWYDGNGSVENCLTAHQLVAR